MGRTFVSIGEHSFWLRDSLLELWLRLASLHIENPQEPGGVAAKIRDHWLLASRGDFNGCVLISISEDIATAKGKQLVRDAIQTLQRALKVALTKISGDSLNLLGIEGDVETWRLIEVGQAFLDLVDGKITTTASEDMPIPGSR